MTDHIIAVPRWFLGVRIAQLVVAGIVLGFNGYGVYYIPYKVLVYSLAIASATIIFLVYYLVASTFGRKAYNFWAILAAECLAVVLWIINFSLVGALADWWTVQCTYDPYYGYYVCFYDKRDLALEKRNTTTISTYYSILVATAIAGALEFVLFLATLITFSIRLHRHRRSSMQASAANPPAYSLAYPLVENAYEPSVKADARPPPPPYT